MFIPRRIVPWVYPRVCGGTNWNTIIPRQGLGLSPRVRGNPAVLQIAGAVRGSIPACAGEPRHLCISVRRERVYPRVCGGTILNDLNERIINGLSPRVRGNHSRLASTGWLWRSIPACAGEPR